MRSQNNYPALTAKSRVLYLWKISDAKRSFRLRNGSAGFLLVFFADWFHHNIERLNKEGEPWDEWAYAYRYVRGSNASVSNHASGTAIDLNATKHPLGKWGTFKYRVRGKIAEWRIRRHLKRYNNCIRWGGDYIGRKDEMHFEINRPLGDCEKVAKKLMNTRRGRRILKANPGQKRVILS